MGLCSQSCYDSAKCIFASHLRFTVSSFVVHIHKHTVFIRRLYDDVCTIHVHQLSRERFPCISCTCITRIHAPPVICAPRVERSGCPGPGTVTCLHWRAAAAGHCFRRMARHPSPCAASPVFSRYPSTGWHRLRLIEWGVGSLTMCHHYNIIT